MPTNAKNPKKQPQTPTLTTSCPINDTDIWFVDINGEKRIPCKLTSLSKSFESSKESWNVVVLGRWIGGNSKRYEVIN